jgi:hypothetical protein
MKVEIYHNISKNAFFGLNSVFEKDDSAPHGHAKRQARNVAEQHELVKVFEYDAEELDGMVLEGAFHRFNVGEDDFAQAYRARQLRSLSVGDVVVLHYSEPDISEAWSVESVGFKPRQSHELRIVTDPAEAEKLIRERYEFRSSEPLNVTVPWTG